MLSVRLESLHHAESLGPVPSFHLVAGAFCGDRLGKLALLRQNRWLRGSTAFVSLKFDTPTIVTIERPGRQNSSLYGPFDWVRVSGNEVRASDMPGTALAQFDERSGIWRTPADQEQGVAIVFSAPQPDPKTLNGPHAA